MVQNPNVIVLILSYNGKFLLKECLESYLNNSYPNFEIILIDNGSSDGTDEYIKENFPKVSLLRIENNLGYSGGMNKGLDEAFNKRDADYVLISNNDVKAHKDVVKELVSTALLDNKIGFVTGKVYFYDSPEILQTVGKMEHKILWMGTHIGYKEKDIGQYEFEKEIQWCDDIFWLVNRKVFKETGGYDEEFFLTGEDYDWQARAKQKGFKIFYNNKAKIWHKDSMTVSKASPLRVYYTYRNKIIIQYKYRSKKEFRIFSRFYIKKTSRSIIGSIVKSKSIKMAYSIFKGLISGYIWVLKNNRIKKMGNYS